MRIALALGSGGARGYAHIGAIRELEKRGHEIVAISGSSMGAVVGGMYAAGKLDEFEEWIGTLNQRNVLKLVDPSLSGTGAIRGRRLTAKLSQLLDGVRIENLDIPFTAVATDLQARREVWFTRGPLDVALRASFAIPSVVTPAVVGDRIMVDGGVLNPVPMEPLMAFNADVVVAVSLTGRRGGTLGAAISESSDSSDSRSWRRQRLGDVPKSGDSAQGGEKTKNDLVGVLANRLIPVIDDSDLAKTAAGSRVRQVLADRAHSAKSATGESAESLDSYELPDDLETATSGEDAAENFGTLPKSLGLFDVVVQSLDCVEALITGYRMAGNPPDVLVDVPADLASAFDFHRAHEVIRIGRRLAVAAFDRAGL